MGSVNNGVIIAAQGDDPQKLERLVIGAMIVQPTCHETVFAITDEECFEKSSHRIVFRTIATMRRDGLQVDIATIADYMVKKRTLDDIGGAYELAKLTNEVASTAHIETWCKLLVNRKIGRHLVRMCNDTIRSIMEGGDEIDALMAAKKAVEQLSSEGAIDMLISGKVLSGMILDQLMKARESAMNNDGIGITGIPTPVLDLTEAISGWQKQELVILAARPGMGKTAFAMSVMQGCVKSGIPSVIFSLEMGARALGMRLASMNTGVDGYSMRSGTFSESDMQSVMNFCQGLEDDSDMLFIDDTPGLDIDLMRGKVGNLVKNYGVGMVIVDYIQLMSAKQLKNSPREQVISYISRQLKLIAKEYDISVVALSQLSRAVESRSDKKPQLSDLRESGAIEQDADMVLFLYRPEYYGIGAYEDGSSTSGIGEVIIAKQRNGPLSTVKAYFNSANTSWGTMTSSHMVQAPQEPRQITQGWIDDSEKFPF
jgi:replicative DNA helicase